MVLSLFAGAISLETVIVAAQQAPSRPTFSAATEIVQLDVSVLDRKRRAVTGLQASDFVVLENGKPRPVDTVVEVKVPRPDVPSAPWLASAPYDVATNQLKAKRIVVIVIDDALVAGAGSSKLWAINKTREIARKVISDLGPDDLSGVVFTFNNRTAQGLTTDHRRLLDAVNSAPMFSSWISGGESEPAPDDAEAASAEAYTSQRPTLSQMPACWAAEHEVEVLRDISRSLRPVQDMRKLVVLISPGFSIDARNSCSTVVVPKLLQAFREAQLSNVMIHPLDPRGLLTGIHDIAGSASQNALRNVIGIKGDIEYLRTVAETAGARVVANNNDPDKQVNSILDESRSYYLVGFRPAMPMADTKLRKIEVKVRRPGVDVRARKGFYPSDARDAGASIDTASSADDAASMLLPKTGLALRVSVAPFAGADRKAAAAIVLNVTHPIGPLHGTAASGEARIAEMQFVARAFNSVGRSVGANRQTLKVQLKPGASGTANYEVVSRFPFSPGRYELRIGLVSDDDKRAGSVFADVDVPDFWREPLSLSGVVLTSDGAPKTSSGGAFSDLLPIVPTTRREFSAGDNVSAFMRVYQTGRDVPVRVATQVTDSRGVNYWPSTTDVQPSGDDLLRSADYRLDLPLRRLPKGDYLLSIDASAGSRAAQRTVRFAVR